MENWGLIITSDDASIVDPNSADLQKKQKAMSHIAHEVGHNWFGNIVTMGWWSGLYLNEGLCNLVSWVKSQVLVLCPHSLCRVVHDHHLRPALP